MKLDELLTVTESSKGTYAGVRFDDKTNESLYDFVSTNKIPNSLKPEHYHTTLLYSEKFLPKYEPIGEYAKPLVGQPSKFEVWHSQPDADGKKTACLVLTYDCDDLVQRHKELMEEHKATYSFPEYKTHVTLSYDIGDMSIEKLPKYDSPIVIIEEYGEELKTDWAQSKS